MLCPPLKNPTLYLLLNVSAMQNCCSSPWCLGYTLCAEAPTIFSTEKQRDSEILNPSWWHGQGSSKAVCTWKEKYQHQDVPTVCYWLRAAQVTKRQGQGPCSGRQLLAVRRERPHFFFLLVWICKMIHSRG